MHRPSRTHSRLIDDNMGKKKKQRVSGKGNNLFKKIKTTLFAAILLSAYILLCSRTHGTRLNDMQLSFKQAHAKHIHTHTHTGTRCKRVGAKE